MSGPATRAAERQSPAFYALILVLVMMAIGPIYLMLATSLKLNVDITSGTSSFLFMPTLQNYETVLCDWLPYDPGHVDYCDKKFARGLKNSLIIALMSTALTLLLGCMAAYALVRFKFMGRDTVSLTTLMMRMVPPFGIRATTRIISVVSERQALHQARTSIRCCCSRPSLLRTCPSRHLLPRQPRPHAPRDWRYLGGGQCVPAGVGNRRPQSRLLLRMGHGRGQAGNAGDHALNVWLAGVSLSDADSLPRLDAERVKLSLAGLGVACKELYETKPSSAPAALLASSVCIFPASSVTPKPAAFSAAIGMRPKPRGSRRCRSMRRCRRSRMPSFAPSISPRSPRNWPTRAFPIATRFTSRAFATSPGGGIKRNAHSCWMVVLSCLKERLLGEMPLQHVYPQGILAREPKVDAVGDQCCGRSEPGLVKIEADDRG